MNMRTKMTLVYSSCNKTQLVSAIHAVSETN